MGSRAPIRFAVAAFTDAQHLLPALAALSSYGLRLSLLARESVFTEPAVAAAISNQAPSLKGVFDKRRQLIFGPDQPVLACSEGLLYDRLARAARAGFHSFTEVLALWMVPRHAARLNVDVDAGRILLWARLLFPEDEVTVCTALLAARPLRVEVHDLVSALGGSR